MNLSAAQCSARPLHDIMNPYFRCSMKIADFKRRHQLISALRDIDIIGIRKLANTLPRLLIPAPTEELYVKTRYGFTLRVDPVRDKGVDRTVYYTGTYEKGTLEILKNLLRPGDRFADVGANIGLMSLFASDCVRDNGTVLAFEPHPLTRSVLQENIRLNDRTNIRVVAEALGSENGQSRIYDRLAMNKGGASLINPGEEVESYVIEVVRFEDMIQGEELPHVVKIDVEGFELEALKGFGELLSEEHSPMLIVECSGMRENTFGSDTAALHEFLSASDTYRLFKSRAGKERVSPLIEIAEASQMPEHDNIYCFTAQHLQRLPAHLFVHPPM